MKLNFWQWIGVVLLVVGLIVYARGKGFFGGTAPVDNTPNVPTNSVVAPDTAVIPTTQP